ncbi:MAG: phosphate ABC transporter substrate-binding protein [Wenzhouxiangella sp.]
MALLHSVIMLAILGGCSQDGDSRGEQSSRLILTGSSTVAPLAGEIARRFEARQPGVRVDVQTGGSSRGIADVRRGMADIGMVSRALSRDEADLAGHPIALDGVGIIVHRDNPVSALTDEQIVAIFTGRHTRWSEVGGTDERITIVNKAEGRATLEMFLGYFGMSSQAIRADVVVGDNMQGVRTVAGDRSAIGYVSIGTAVYEASRGTAIRLLPMGNIEATLANVRDGTFPLSRPLHLVTEGALSPLAEAFIAFASSREVSDLVEAQYFVPIDH